MNKQISLFVPLLLLCLNIGCASANDKQTAVPSRPQYAKLSDTAIDDVHWTDGFWAERFNLCHDVMIPNMWTLLDDPDTSHSYQNFLVAAGIVKGEHHGPTWHDGDFYKWLEAVAYTYAITKDEKLDRQMDEIIEVIGKVQRKDGYIHTPVIIDELNNTQQNAEFKNRLDFETYNMGHLMTCASVHYQATGKTTLLDIAEKSADYLCGVYKAHPEKLANNAICPSHYMGIVDLYRITGKEKYLQLASGLIEIRKMVQEGSDHNQDRIPFFDQTEAAGHSVRANYLYAGATDIYAETGNENILEPLEKIWNDIVYKKMYITGATGALYDGASPDCAKNHKSIRMVHQAYGRAYQLPNLTAYNESCATIGFVYWNKRMLQLTADAKYADILELALYNGVLATISLDGKEFFYTNPLRVVKNEPFEMRWSRQRQKYISCFCCPPNTVRTVAEASSYFYGIAKDGLYVHLYGSGELDTTLPDGSQIKLRQQTDYPWDGKITISIDQAPDEEVALFVRIPGWTKQPCITVNDIQTERTLQPQSYCKLKRTWKTGDKIQLDFPMDVQLMEANPLTEEVRNQAAVKRGPIVYCLESVDLPENVNFSDISMKRNQSFTNHYDKNLLSGIVVLECNAVYRKADDWNNTLYREISKNDPKELNIRLIPYYAWGNRGKTEMTVWMPLE